MPDFNVASLIGTIGAAVMFAIFIMKGIKFFTMGIRFMEMVSTDTRNGSIDLKVIRDFVDELRKR